MKKLGVVSLLLFAAIAWTGCAYRHGHDYGQPRVPGPAAKANTIGATTRTVNGAYVINVLCDSPAAEAGIKVGDLIVELGGHPVRSAPELERRILSARVGREAAVTVLRNDRELWYKVPVQGIFRGYAEGLDIIEPHIGVDTVTAQGAYVVGTWPGWPAAEQLDLAVGDIILEIGGRATHPAGGMNDALTQIRGGIPASILYLSKGTLSVEEITAGTVALDEQGNKFQTPTRYKFKIPILFGYREKTVHGETFSTMEIGNLLFFHLFRYREHPGKTAVEILSIPFDWLL